MAEIIKLTDELRNDEQHDKLTLNEYIGMKYEGVIADRVKANPALAKLSPLAHAMRDLGISGNTTIQNLQTTVGAPNWLLPEWIAQVMVKDNDASILSYICSAPTPVSSDSIRAPYVDFKGNAANKKTITRKRIAEGGEIPVGIIGVGSTAITLYKKGAGIEQTYESIKHFTLELMALALRRIASDDAKTKVDDAVDVIVSGDGNDNAITEFTAKTATANTITADELMTYGLKFWSDTGLIVDTIVADEDFYNAIHKMQYDTTKGFGASSKLTFATPQFDFSKCSLIKASVPQTSASKNRIVLMNKELAIKEYIDSTSLVREVATNILNQTKLATFTEISGFGLFDKTARKAIVSA
jgi:hypothetical protein